MNGLGRFQLSLMILVSAVTVLVCAGEAVARPGGGFSLGSRGLRTFQVPPTTRTAPRQVTPFERSMTQPGMAQAGQSAAMARNGAAATPRAFHRPGLLGGLAAGFIGAGLLGMLFGNGFFGGLGGFASMLGLLAQIALVGGIAWLAWSWWQRRGIAAFAGLSPRQLADAYDRPRSDFASLPGGAAFTPDMASNIDLGPLELRADDFDTFERMLGEIQIAHSRSDVAALQTRVTPEMLTYFAEELATDAGDEPGHAVSKVTLLHGDLSEAWREREADYASVAMRFALDGFTRARAGGEAARGEATHGEARRIEATEVWTFRRVPGGDWQLSAIQQA